MASLVQQFQSKVEQHSLVAFTRRPFVKNTVVSRVPRCWSLQASIMLKGTSCASWWGLPQDPNTANGRFFVSLTFWFEVKILFVREKSQHIRLFWVLHLVQQAPGSVDTILPAFCRKKLATSYGIGHVANVFVHHPPDGAFRDIDFASNLPDWFAWIRIDDFLKLFKRMKLKSKLNWKWPYGLQVQLKQGLRACSILESVRFKSFRCKWIDSYCWKRFFKSSYFKFRIPQREIS